MLYTMKKRPTYSLRNNKVLTTQTLVVALVMVLTLGFMGQKAQAQFYIATNSGLPGLANCSAAWGDIDNDGDLDVALAGQPDGAAGFAGIFINNNGSFAAVPSGNFNFSPPPPVSSAAWHLLEWGDFNNDGRLDLYMVGTDTSGLSFAKIYRNDGNYQFFNIFDFPPGDWYDVEVGDLDNDGDEDVLLVGRESLTDSSVIWYNNHNQLSATYQKGPRFMTADSGAADLGDYDGDGDLDIVMQGKNGSDYATRLFSNDGEKNWSIVANTNFEGVAEGDLDWFDIEGDGDLDLMLTGGNASDVHALIYLNTPGAATPFDTVINDLTGIKGSSTSFADQNGDGAPDLLATGDSLGSATLIQPLSIIYQNNPSLPAMVQEPFTTGDITLNQAIRGTAEFIDFNQNGVIDLFVSGTKANNEKVAVLYLNFDTAFVNQPPAAPTNMVASPGSGTIDFSWDAPTDDVTPSAALTYQLLIEETSNSFAMSAPLADTATGRRNVARAGTIVGTNWSLSGAVTGRTYCARVSAIDNCNAGSAFSASSCSVVLGTNGPNEFHALQAWPQPAVSNVNVRVEGLTGSGQLDLMDLNGRILATMDMDLSETISLDLEGYTPGLYLLRLQSDGQDAPTTLKIIKQ